MMQTMRDQILGRIRRFTPGTAFTAKDFLTIATRGTVDVTLAALTRDGKIRRVRRGLYDVPKVNPALGGELTPDINEAVQAMARRQRWKIVPDGPWAANLLGLSTQVPARIVYLTDGPNKEVLIGRRKVTLKHARPKAIAGIEGTSALVVQALRHLGKERVGDAEIARIRSMLSPADQRRLLKDVRFGADWIFETVRKIAAEER